MINYETKNNKLTPSDKKFNISEDVVFTDNYYKEVKRTFVPNKKPVYIVKSINNPIIELYYYGSINMHWVESYKPQKQTIMLKSIHNFPLNTKIKYFCLEKTETEAQLKEILKLAIDNDVNFDYQEIKIDSNYPLLCFSVNSNELTRCKKNINDKDCIISITQFKQFIKGIGDVNSLKIPFSEEITLNSDYKAIITKEKIVVGCQEFTHDIIKKLYQLSQKALKS